MPSPAPAGVRVTVEAVEAVAEEAGVESVGLFISGFGFALSIHTSVCQSR